MRIKFKRLTKELYALREHEFLDNSRLKFSEKQFYGNEFQILVTRCRKNLFIRK